MGERAGVVANLLILLLLALTDVASGPLAPVALTGSFILSLLLPVFSIRRREANIGLALFLANLVIYLAIAALVNLRVGIDHLVGTELLRVETYEEAVYFTIVTFTTLGYGDYRPSPELRLMASLQALYGYISLGLILAAFVKRAQAPRD